MDEIDWFVVQLKPNGLKLALEHLARQSFSVFAPTKRGIKRVRGRQVEATVPLFPGYLFVSFDPKAPGWQAINSTRGVARLISLDPRAPTALPHGFIHGLHARCDAEGQLLPPDTLGVGDRIRVVSGPFANLVTQIEEIDDDERFSVLMDLMGRKVTAQLKRFDVEKL